mmetsp:Transcript_18416/g.36816  ORF Transcript_18416/g.36816 Transcript_18416/m.36816 type:complete len:225 (+) Transcript_18416:167-841(+)
MSDLLALEDAFARTFYAHRPQLASFGKCGTVRDLHYVRDAWLFGMACDLCPVEAVPVKEGVVRDALGKGGSKGLNQTIDAARAATGWPQLVEALHSKALLVGTDLRAVWGGLEAGRLEWLNACARCHEIKELIRDALVSGGGEEGDRSDGLMVWKYCLALNVPMLKAACKAWAEKVKMEKHLEPLKGYKADLWDPRLPEWQAIERGVTDAADRGGAILQEAWES